MRKPLYYLFMMLAVLSCTSHADIAGFEEGKHYNAVGDEATDTPVIYEFFNYGCPACYQTESFVSRVKAQLPEDVRFEYVPLELNPQWAIYAKAYYLGELLGVLDKSHEALFRRIHLERNPLRGEDDLKAFFVGLGVSAEDFDKTNKSFALNSKLNAARQLGRKLRVSGTPTFVVNGRYVLNSGNLGAAGLEKAMLTMPQAALKN